MRKDGNIRLDGRRNFCEDAAVPGRWPDVTRAVAGEERSVKR